MNAKQFLGPVLEALTTRGYEVSEISKAETDGIAVSAPDGRIIVDVQPADYEAMGEAMKAIPGVGPILKALT